MKSLSEITNQRKKLLHRYKQLIENAYNLRQTDSAESDISEYQALKLLDQLNRLNFLDRDSIQPTL